ncbi:MAG: RNA-binding protein [Gammaproteobacteria bacterium]|nr:RNA-binding protein [Gammaproteobacteria bacterium]
MKIYVGNLPFSTRDTELRELFGRFGDVSDAVVISDRDTGRSKGFGFVEMPSADAAKEAIRAMNDTDMGGRKIKVNEAMPKADRPPRRRS